MIFIYTCGKHFPLLTTITINSMKTLSLKTLSRNFPSCPADLFPMPHILVQFLLWRVREKTLESDVSTNHTGLKTTFEQINFNSFWFFVEMTAVQLILSPFCSWQYLLCHSLTSIGIVSHIVIKGSWRILVKSLKFKKRVKLLARALDNLPYFKLTTDV